MKAEQPELMPAKRETAQVAVEPTAHDPGALLRLAVDKDLDVDKLAKLIDLQRSEQAEQSRRAFFQAVVGFQNKVPAIHASDSADGLPYAKLDRIWRTAQPIMAECGLGVIWTSFRMDGAMCHLEGMLSHVGGYSIPLVRDMPLPDANKRQNACQRAGSADSYAKRYAVLDALGIVVSRDDNGTGGAKTITEAEAEELDRAIMDTGTDLAQFKMWAGVARLADLPAAKLGEARRLLAKKAGAR